MAAEWLTPYQLTLLALGLSALLFVLQILVVDLAGIRAKHKPGHPVVPDGSFHFRASRAHANTNESYGLFLALVVFGIAVQAQPAWLNGAALVYLLGRLGHMLCYYANLSLARSIAFGVALVGLIGMLGAGLLAL